MVLSLDAFGNLMGLAGLPVDCLAQLEAQLAAAKEQLISLRSATAAAAGHLAEAAGSQQRYMSLAEQQAAAAQQLCAFAQAVSGRIPLSSACNNPGCVSLAQRSELLLVWGKSCVCARCKAARWVKLCDD
jgi:hypothetical protein